jgi:hypothetical protein
MCDLNDAVEKIVLHKGNLIKNNTAFSKYIKSVLNEHGIISDKTKKNDAEVLIRVFKMGAVDGMTYDMGAALDIPEWKRQNKRREILRKKFLEE